MGGDAARCPANEAAPSYAVLGAEIRADLGTGVVEAQLCHASASSYGTASSDLSEVGEAAEAMDVDSPPSPKNPSGSHESAPDGPREPTPAGHYLGAFRDVMPVEGQGHPGPHTPVLATKPLAASAGADPAPLCLPLLLNGTESPHAWQRAAHNSGDESQPYTPCPSSMSPRKALTSSSLSETCTSDGEGQGLALEAVEARLGSGLQLSGKEAAPREGEGGVPPPASPIPRIAFPHFKLAGGEADTAYVPAMESRRRLRASRSALLGISTSMGNDPSISHSASVGGRSPLGLSAGMDSSSVSHTASMGGSPSIYTNAPLTPALSEGRVSCMHQAWAPYLLPAGVPDLEVFLRAITPSMPFESDAALADARLSDVWTVYEESSAFGLDVPRLGGPQGLCTSCCLPFLSAVHTFEPVGAGQGGPSAVDAWNAPCRRALSWAATASVAARVPLWQQVLELREEEESRAWSACLADLHPMSWFAVAWYPLRSIPDATPPARFLTFHCLAAAVQAARSARLARPQACHTPPPPLAPLHVVRLPVTGLEWHRLGAESRESWTQPLAAISLPYDHGLYPGATLGPDTRVEHVWQSGAVVSTPYPLAQGGTLGWEVQQEELSKGALRLANDSDVLHILCGSGDNPPDLIPNFPACPDYHFFISRRRF